MPLVEVAFFQVGCGHPGCRHLDVTDDYSAGADPAGPTKWR